MFVPDYYEYRFELRHGIVTKVLTAFYEVRRGPRMGEKVCIDVYEEDERGVCRFRNVYPCVYHSYAVAFPGFPRCMNSQSWYYDPRPAWEEEWRECNRKPLLSYEGRRETESVEVVCSKYPDFRYVVRKLPDYRYGIMDVLRVWLRHPEVELLFGAGCGRLGMDGRFWHLTEANRRLICRFIRGNPGFGSLSPYELLSAARHEKPRIYAEFLTDVSPYDRGRVTFSDYLYLRRQPDVPRRFTPGISGRLRFFCDTIRMLERSAHGTDDPYWRHPRDLVETHDRLLAELEAVEAAELLEKKKEMRKKIRGIMNRWGQVPQDAGEYTVQVTFSSREWKRQADALHQCILACGYMERAAKGDFVICFIRRGDSPVATAQVYPDWSIGQFYADELDRDNCLPSPDVRDSFGAWLDAAREILSPGLAGEQKEIH